MHNLMEQDFIYPSNYMDNSMEMIHSIINNESFLDPFFLCLIVLKEFFVTKNHILYLVC